MLFSEDIINSICDLKEGKKEVKEVKLKYPHPREIIDNIMGEIGNQENLFFKDANDLKEYLAYLIYSREGKFIDNYPETRIIECRCGSIWKLYVKPHTVRSTDMWSEYYTSSEFICPICRTEFMVHSVSIQKAQSEYIPPKLFSQGDRFSYE